jgi:hypothetical protein
MKDGWYVLATHNGRACFRVGIENDIVVWAAPYGRSLLGKAAREARRWGELTWFAPYRERQPSSLCGPSRW